MAKTENKNLSKQTRKPSNETTAWFSGHLHYTDSKYIRLVLQPAGCAHSNAPYTLITLQTKHNSLTKNADVGTDHQNAAFMLNQIQ